MEIKLRQWQNEDLDRFAEMNSDTEVMRHFPSCLTHEESEVMFHRLQQSIQDQGWGLWAVDVEGLAAGFTGLSKPKFTSHFTPCVEIGWRFRKEYWGKGIAFRAAQLAENFAFRELQLETLYSFTSTTNIRSRKLMERLDFLRNPEEDFLHPNLPDGHPLQKHVLYRKRNPNLA